jgi:hypothetical protein
MLSPLARLAALVTLCAACAHASPTSEYKIRPDRNLLTREELQERGYRNAYDGVEAMRFNWLSERGVDSFQNPGRVMVYLDNNRLGGVETLRQITTETIEYIRYYDAVAASARWGIGHTQGVIFVATFRTPNPTPDS